MDRIRQVVVVIPVHNEERLLPRGGFPRLRSHEDRALVDRLRQNGAAVWSTDTIRVRTSGRTDARALQGFGAYLLSLTREPAAALKG